jgi:hypothetical protein
MDTATATPRISLGRQGWNFVRHFLEMCVAMCMGGALVAVVVFAAIPALFGSPDLRELFPELALMIISVILALPMAGWMRFRGMPWRPIFEMSLVPIALAVLIIGMVRAGAVPGSALQVEFGMFCGISCVGMLVVMLFRLDLYTGRTGHRMGHGTHAAHAA